MRLRDISIRHKLLLIILVTSGSALLAACAAFVAFDFVSTRDALSRRLVSLADVVGTNSTAALTFDDPIDARQTLNALRSERHIISAAIYDGENQRFAAFHRDRKDFTDPTAHDIGHVFHEDRIEVLRPIMLDGERIGTIFVQSDLLELDERIRRYAQIVVLFILVATVIAVLVGFRLRSVISDPIMRLLEIMQQVSEDKLYSVRAPKHSNDELGELIEGFNLMLNQIQHRDEELVHVQEELGLRARELQVELTERERAESRIRASLLEKEVLLKEIHHRVKNNLQIIASLLDLQARQAEDDHVTNASLVDSRNRVRSMALVHEHLYQTEDLARIDLGEYLDELCRNLTLSYGAVAQSVDVQTLVADVSFDVDTAIPCGLIINELVSNSLKYAFPDGRQGKLIVILRGLDEDAFELSVQDDGIGLPADIDIHDSPSLGLQLVTALSRQIHGAIEVDRSNGTHFLIRFTGLPDDDE
ncbi:MAG: HAMP domain-containing protein [Gemmatimonadetes bacterium]|jgi:two-component sensor histidine kinase/HAMP domain-containing protein|nr:HAMP domain-containing protein [Gemmatimonadota bacterium]MBT6146196.1 HAMP domain-containing protein [Gemmatimonadota bacterium]MBT7863945.1 HAMP domain-containing protein [Gemmatimonadota bacterium]